MNRLLRIWSDRPLLAGVLLAALVLRGLIPAGYMPATDHAFALQLCQVGLEQAPEHSGSSGHDAGSATYCSFGFAPGAGPVADAIAVTMSLQAIVRQVLVFRPVILTARSAYSPPPRAPPAFS